MKQLLTIAFFAALALAGCDNSDEGVGAASKITVSAPANPVVLSSDAQITPASESLSVECLKNSGNPDFKLAWKLASNESWLKLSLEADGSNAAQELAGEASRTVYLVIEENPDQTPRTANILLNNETTATVAVTQEGFKPGTITVTPVSYPTLNSDAHTPAAVNLTVTCLRYNGEADPLAAWSLVSDKAWLKLSPNADGSAAVDELEGIGTQNVYLVAEENTGTEDRTAKITLNGASAPTLTVTQAKPVALPPLPVPAPGLIDGIDDAGECPGVEASYVGAFWRSAQIGERVIRTKADAENAGAWTATVAWYDSAWDPAAGDGVVLGSGDSPDPAIRTNAPADADAYPVGGTLATVSGTTDADGYIVFRIGLTRAYKAFDKDTAPARYAVVLLSYSGNTRKQLIYLRQGEGADYVMRPGDADGAGKAAVDNRSYARRFLPYNLTASDAEWATYPGGAAVTANPQVAVNGASQAQYPSQGGALFQGQASQDTWMRRVFSLTFTGSVTGLTRYSGPEFWEAANEACPAGYRRPRDGGIGVHNTTYLNAGSEMRQSIWLNLDAIDGKVGTNAFDLGNSTWGYYADGFFDRRPADEDGVVASGTQGVAFKGRMFFNPATRASLFFPAAGYRTTGAYQKGGSSAYYWTATTMTTTNMSTWYISNTRACPYSQRRDYSWSVRCVRDE